MLLAGGDLAAQMGNQRDPAGAVQRPPPAEWNIPPAPVLSPEESLKSFRLPPGFRIEIVAAEPLVQSPVALDFGPDGRLWVVEMSGYMPDADGRGELDPVNRIVVLEDTNGDGRMDKRTVYMEGLVLPRTVKVLSDGVLVGEPPVLWHTRDRDGDGRMDEKVAVASDFSIRETNPEGGANALIWGLDNWLVATAYSRRLRWQRGAWEAAPAVNRGQWGQAMDDYGRLFTNSNSDYVRVDLVPNHYLARNPNLPGPTRREEVKGGVYHQVDANQELWPARVTPGVNRGYWEGHLRASGTLRNFTAVCGPVIYRGDNFPTEFQGNYFIAEPSAHVIRRSILTEEDGILYGRNAYEQKEFLGSTEERFRPVNLYTAPDGTLHVVDLHRGVLQHRQFLTSYLRQQIVERDLEKPLDLGRIYRIVHDARRPGPAPRLAAAPTTRLVEHLSHPNGWWRDTAQRLLVERGDRSVSAALRSRALAADAPSPHRLHALWTLEGLGALDLRAVRAMLQDPDPKLRAAAARLAEPWLVSGDAETVSRVVALGQDGAREVRLQAALSIGEAPWPMRKPALARLLRDHASEPYMVPAVTSGLTGREAEFLAELAAAAEWRDEKNGYSDSFQMLAGAVGRGDRPDDLEQVFRLVRAETGIRWQRLAILSGLSSSGLRKVPAVPRELEAAAKASDPEVARAATALLDRLVWPEKFGGRVPPLTTSEKRLVENGRTRYTEICAGCHQPDGRGLPGVAPSLVNSRWVLGSEGILARIVLKGKKGLMPAGMPPLEMIAGETLAEALSYVRRSWGHEAAPVSPNAVETMRRAIILRTEPFTDPELETLAP